MTLPFVMISALMSTAVAVALLWPLLRRRADGRPAAAVAAIAVVLAVLAGGTGLYAALGNFQWDAAPSTEDTPVAMTARLAKRLAAEPDNLEGWLMLGRSYGALGQYPLAVRAYQRADRLAGGQNVEAIVGVAESLIAQDTAQLEGAAGRLFERALEISPGYPKAVFYAAFAALARGELPLARGRFDQMLALNPPPEVRAIIEQRMAALDAQINGEGGAQQAPKIEVHVTLAPALAAKVPAGAALFVAARDPAAPGPPFAVKRLQARFPVDVELTTADAMLESRRISAGQQLEVVARVALGGTPTATSGDPFGQVSYHVGRDGRLNIVIDRLSP